MFADTPIRLLRRASVSALFAWAAGAAPAFAHPGHASAYSPGAFAHYLTSPVHLTALGAVVAIGVMGILRWSRVKSRRTRPTSDRFRL